MLMDLTVRVIVEMQMVLHMMEAQINRPNGFEKKLMKRLAKRVLGNGITMTRTTTREIQTITLATILVINRQAKTTLPSLMYRRQLVQA